MMPGIVIAGCMVGAYLAGSVPFGWLIGRMRGVDIREHGSRNIGATNCGRVCGWPWGVLAFLLDVAKGFGPVYVVRTWVLPTVMDGPGSAMARWGFVVLVAVMPIVGHVFPVWLGFRGGKAVATSLGVLLAVPMLWWLALA
ncbi:MAG: glycerol-3-phosphate acyltransferase, partial [Planctomycetes bacterium]|nr:glycerol-3-phosphate acyltransferase [Planctomycetota bacterium]